MSNKMYEALVCPLCPKVFVESLWSLIAHITASHRDEPPPIDYHSLQRLKTVVPKSSVCVIRPAFTADGTRTDYLNFFSDGSTGTTLNTEIREAEKRITTAHASKSEIAEESSPPQAAPILPQSISPQSSSESPVNTPAQPRFITGGNKRVKKNSPYTRSTKKQICDKCGEIFDNRCLLTLHLMSHKKRTHPFQCQINGCFQLYDSKQKFRSHLSRVHRELTPAQLETLLIQAATFRIEKPLGHETPPPIDSELESTTETLAKVVEKAIKQEVFE